MGLGIKDGGTKTSAPSRRGVATLLKGGRDVSTKPTRISALTLNDGRRETKIFLTHPLHEVEGG